MRDRVASIGREHGRHVVTCASRAEYAADLLVLATEVAGIGGVELPLEISAIDSFQQVTDAPERSLSVVTSSAIA